MKNISTYIKKNNSEIIFFGFLFTFILLLMKGAFAVDIYVDDFFFFKISKANSIPEFLNFFSPFRDYFYRPIPTELYYFLLNKFNQNLILAHSISFSTYFIGLIFIFKSTKFISKNLLFSYLFTFIYAINFTHVFQLYQLNTYQEICLLTFLSISFYLFISKKWVLSLLFYVFALMSKETAILFPVLIIGYELFKTRKVEKRHLKIFLPFLIVSIIFIIFYYLSSLNVSEIDTYKIILSPKLIINNTIWYLLWSMGVPNFIPNYIQSIFFKPLPEFWNLMTSSQIKHYFYLLIIFYSLFFPLFISVILKQKKLAIRYLSLILILLFFFLLFLSPTIPIIHRWMVRLTVPLLFISAVYALVIYLGLKQDRFLKSISVMVLSLYVVISIVGIRIHESSGLFEMNSSTIRNARSYFKDYRQSINKFNTIYFVDTSKYDFGGSEEIKNMLGGDFFVDTFFPDKKINIIYGHENKIIPPHSFVISSDDILKW